MTKSKPRLERLHDLKTAYSNFNTVLNLLRDGRRLEGKTEDIELSKILQQLEKALGYVHEEIEIQGVENYGKTDS